MSSLVPKGMFGIERIGIRLGVRDVEAHRRFYSEALGLPQGDPVDGAMTFLAGDTVMIVEQAADAPNDAAFDGKGWRYITFQVFDVDREHAYVLAHGGREARAPVTLGTTAQNLDGARSRRQLDRAVAARLADGIAGAIDRVSPSATG